MRQLELIEKVLNSLALFFEALVGVEVVSFEVADFFLEVLGADIRRLLLELFRGYL